MLHWIYETLQLFFLIQCCSFRAVPELFSILGTSPAHFSIVFRFAALDKKNDIFLLVSRDILKVNNIYSVITYYIQCNNICNYLITIASYSGI